MTSLAGLNLDPNVQENSGGVTILPAGKYKACLIRDELRDNRNKNGKILEIKVQVVEGTHAGTILTDYINIINPSPQCQAIGQGTLRRICNICKVEYPPQDTAGLMGKAFVIDVAVEKFTSNTTGNELDSNKIKRYSPVEELGHQQIQQGTSPQAQPQQSASGW